MASKSRGKQSAVSSDESDMEPEGVYRYTRTRTGAVAPVDYSALARGIEVSESHSVIAESQASNTSIEKEVFASMTNTPKETARRLEQEAQVQKEQFEMIRAQQESIDSLKQMLAQLLEDKRKSTDKASSKKSKGKRKEGESSSSVQIEEKEQSTSGLPKSSSKGKDNQDHGEVHSKRMNQLEQRLEALTNRKGLQEAGVVRPYPAEGLCSIPSRVQSSDPPSVRWQRVTKPTYLLF